MGEIHDCGESLLKLLVASLSPAIYGHDLVKAGLILGLFGGDFRIWRTFFERSLVSVVIKGEVQLKSEIWSSPFLGARQLSFCTVMKNDRIPNTNKTN